MIIAETDTCRVTDRPLSSWRRRVFIKRFQHLQLVPLQGPRFGVTSRVHLDPELVHLTLPCLSSFLNTGHAVCRPTPTSTSLQQFLVQCHSHRHILVIAQPRFGFCLS